MVKDTELWAVSKAQLRLQALGSRLAVPPQAEEEQAETGTTSTPVIPESSEKFRLM